MVNRKDKQTIIQFMVSMIGGFLGTYGLINFHNIFASAQTTNMAGLVTAIVGRDVPQILERLGAVIVYVLGLSASVIIPHYTKMNLHKISLGFSILAIISVNFMPANTNEFVTLYPLFFVTAFQWCVFKGAGGYNTSSIFSTNNLKQFSTALVAYCYDKDPELLHKARIYGGVLAFFYSGALIAIFSSEFLASHGILVGILPAILTMSLVIGQERQNTIREAVETI